jgi:hypothetical protein
MPMGRIWLVYEMAEDPDSHFWRPPCLNVHGSGDYDLKYFSDRGLLEHNAHPSTSL